MPSLGSPHPEEETESQRGHAEESGLGAGRLNLPLCPLLFGVSCPPASCLLLPGRAGSSEATSESWAFAALQPLPWGQLHQLKDPRAAGDLDRSPALTPPGLGFPSHEKAGMITIFLLPCHRESIQQVPDKHRDPRLLHKGLAIWDPCLCATLSPAHGAALALGTLGPGGAP